MVTSSISTIFVVYINLLICYIHGELTKINLVTQNDPEIKIARNYKLFVNYGRSEYLNPKNLSITYKKDSNCRITLLKNDPYSLQIGAITPSTFPCSFHKDTVLYQHFGSLRQMTDLVKFQIRLDTKYKTIVAPLIMYVEIVYEKPLEILKKVDDLIVNELGGLSEPIASNILSVNFDPNGQECTVCFMPIKNGPPFFGDIVNTTTLTPDTMLQKSLRYVPCKEFLSGKLRYAHHRSERSSKKDYIPLVVEVTDKLKSYQKKREFIQVPVRIRRATENHPPKIDYTSASYSLQVDQLMLKALTSQVLRAYDRETSAGSIIFKVTVPPKETEGYLIRTSDPSKPVVTFYQKEIEELKIAFKPPSKLSTNQRLQQIWMEARDSEGAASNVFYIMVVIKPMNSLGPQVVKNVGLAMYEGQSRVLSTKTLSIRDPDNEDDVVITVKEGLFNGRLEKYGKQVFQFTVNDLNLGVLRYIHDDSETYEDAMRLLISDGKHDVSTLVVITLLPKDDEPPQLIYNTGIHLNEGESVKIDQFDLSARDIDTDDTQISFDIIHPPKYGYLIRKPTRVVVPSQSEQKQGEIQTNIKKFSQVDVILGNIFYQHNGGEQFNDNFRFRLSDSNTPPNLSGLKTFQIDIVPVDDVSPKRHPGCPLKMKVVENEKKEFSRIVLRYTDLDSQDNNLVYHVTRKPYFVKPVSKENAGRITLSSDYTKEISRFTQRQVNHFKITYHPPTSEAGVNKRFIRFNFNVTDTHGNFIDNQRFLIELLPVNNQKPIVYVNPLVIYERERRLITTDNLRVYDNDNYARDLSYILKKIPKNGDLLLDGRKMQVGDDFTPNAIRNELLEYIHDGTETISDDIKLIATDDVHTVPIHLKIEILPSDDEKPEVKILQKALHVFENGVLQFNTDVIQASDKDSDEEQLTFIITSPLKYGRMMKAGAPIDGFKWLDIQKGLISYQHRSGEIGLQTQSEILNLNLTDLSDDIIVGGNIFSGVKINIKIQPVDSEPPMISGTVMLMAPEAGKATLTNKILYVTDVDTNLTNVVCNITKGPSLGYVETSAPKQGSEVSQAGLPIQTFTAHDLNQEFINYVQHQHKNIEPTSDEFYVKCSDGNNTSPEVRINIAITPTNDEIPELIIAENIICVEDDLVVFDLTTINPYDRDKPSTNLIMRVTQQPQYGELLLQKNSILTPAEEFTRADLIQQGESALMYQHKGSENKNDYFKIVGMDGKHEVEKIVNIKIISMDDETPRLIVNTGLRMEREDMKVITPYNLKATDLDTNDDSLVYIVMMRPTNGKLQVKISPKVTVDVNKGGNFTQRDINQRKVRYTHTGENKGNRDVIRLDVTDGFNRLINQMFTVMIEPEDKVIPNVITNGVRLNEHDHVILTTEMLSASDLNTPDENLQFIITKTPLKGFLQNLDNPNVPITSFSQLQLASNKISYFHQSDDEAKLDNFEFTVTDGKNKVFRSFRIKINGVNNKRPSVFVKVIQAKQGLDTVITPFEFNVIDNDTDAKNIQLKLVTLPKYGHVLLDRKLRISSFTQEQIETNRISYQHDGSNHLEDSFTVSLTDGQHNDYYVGTDNKVSRDTINIPIIIETVDNDAPKVIVNKGISRLRIRGSNIVMKINKKSLQAVDISSSRDFGAKSRDDEISFSIVNKPKHGRLVNVKNKEKVINKFTQEDINNNQIAYILTNTDSKQVHDSFTFDVYDKKKNNLRQQIFNINWSHVKFEILSLVINETTALAKLKVSRYGNLDETAYVTLQLFNGSAIQGKDYDIHKSLQVQFNPGEKQVEFEISINDDTQYDKKKEFFVGMATGMNTLIHNENVTVTVLDPEDEPTLSMKTATLSTKESIGKLKVDVIRTGDVRNMVKAICFTKPGTAQGTEGSTVTSYKDYITKLMTGRSSTITIFPNETVGICEITIIDDSLYEEEEDFEVHILPLYGAQVNKTAATTVITIQEDPKDEPIFSFDQASYNVDESDDSVRIKVHRHGTDLSVTSYVLFATKQLTPVSAKAYSDYQPFVHTLEFGPGKSEKVVRIKILDDKGRERLEGEEKFEVILLTPRNARIETNTSKSTVLIDDRQSDLPRISFTNEVYTVQENVGVVAVKVLRKGDLRLDTSVRCYTRQNTAKADEDFVERPNTNTSFIHFKKKEKTKDCLVGIINDDHFEATETFKVHLGLVHNGVLDTDKEEAVITIKDDDQPTISFAEQRLYIREPSHEDKQRTLSVIIKREGDLSSKSSVMVVTKDGSAKSAKNYQATAQYLCDGLQNSKDTFQDVDVKVQLVEFAVNKTQTVLDINIYYDPIKNIRTAFSLQLLTDGDSNNITLGLDKTVVFIQEVGRRSGVTFPLEPIVVSLLDYDQMEYRREKPVQGYPLVCVTACNPKHPNFKETESLCKEELINDKLTSYRWQVAAPSYTDGITNPLRDVNKKLFFTTPYHITLDSVYFNAGSRVRCTAQPYSEDGSSGIESFSKDATIDPKVGLCMPRRSRDIAAETFSVQAGYTGIQDSQHKNVIKIKLMIPHYDGLLPVISTKQLSNFELTLSPDASRTAQHTCSNLLNKNEIITKFGFLRENETFPANSQPRQFDVNMRGLDTLRFYNNLDLDTCLWTFETYYNMSELVDICGGKIITDGLVKDAIQSHLTVDVPLYVSYIYHSANDEDGWIDFNHQSSVRLTAVYNTGMLWKDGVALPEKAKLKGNLYPTSIVVRKLDRKLQVNFRTKARFRGLFITQTDDGQHKSEAVLLERPSLPFNLRLIRTDPTYTEPEQLWQMESKYAVGDYTGSYVFQMIPCTVDENIDYSSPPECTPEDAVSFHLNLTIQQTSEPVEATFTLNTRFLLLNNREQWLSNELTTSHVTDVYFKQGQRIFGRVMIDSMQALGDAYHIVVEKVFLCSGLDGYIPTFDPKSRKYGCIADSDNLAHRFKILDRLNPETSSNRFSNINFNASLAVDDVSGIDLVKQAGSDGFSLDSTALFKVSGGRNWFLHIIYTLRSKEGKHRGLGKRSIEEHMVTSFNEENIRSRRAIGEVNREIRSIDGGNKGTNLQMILLERENIESRSIIKTFNDQKIAPVVNHTLITIIVVLIIVILVGVIAGFLVYKKVSGVAPPLVVGGANGGTEI